MEGTKLKEVISTLYEMELNNYLMRDMIEKLDEEIPTYGHRKFIDKPIKEEVLGSSSDSIPTQGVGPAFAVAIISGIIAAFIAPLLIIPTVLVVFFAIYLIITVVKIGSTNHDQNDKDADAYYNYQLELYEKDVNADKKRVELELKQRDFIISERSTIEKKLKQSEALLSELYKASGIEPRFCNIVSIGYMYEFISMGIATKLEGRDGLYYLLLEDARWREVNSKLDDISSKLDTMIDESRAIYSELGSMSKKCDKMISGMKKVAAKIDENTIINEKIAEETEVAAYYAERTAREAEFHNFMHIWNMD